MTDLPDDPDELGAVVDQVDAYRRWFADQLRNPTMVTEPTLAHAAADRVHYAIRDTLSTHGYQPPDSRLVAALRDAVLAVLAELIDVEGIDGR